MFHSTSSIVRSALTSNIKMSSSATRSLTTAKSIIYSTHGEPKDVIKVHTYTIKEPEDNEIVLKTLAFPINPSDINQLEGVYPSKPEKTLQYNTTEPSAIAGNEGLFEVFKTGPGVSSKFQIGDRVVPIFANTGTWTSHNIIKEDQLIKLPKDLSIVKGATIGVNPATAYQLVNNYGLIKGDWLIQNAGTSAVSQMVSQIAKTKGINVISVIRDRDDFDAVAERLTSQGATKVISESQNGDRDVGKELAKLTGGNIKLALNSVGGKSSASIARKLAPGSKIITYGGMSKQPVTFPTSLFIFKNIQALGYWVTENTKADPAGKVKDTEEIVKLYQSGQLKELEVVESVWKLDEFSDEQVRDLIVKGLENSSKGKQLIKIE
ncbi:hypothetical protein WICPIJ_008115 [Wickerhamomyces pijperi]|uniref:enoyl-[acyl-carrier-protein] reductase n=1 Tax=Wickerhamomyces pijperi TaxID=599730 RepID=A0A9P8Q0U9_WICPI|nr:hypothetical protein WICPIJ_008115 [Wickerhamomyces pijperi]